MSESTKDELLKEIRHQIMQRVFHKYAVMRVRMKISYQAHLKSNTITELWMTAIIHSFKFLRNSGQLDVDKKKSLTSEFIYSVLLNSEYKDCIKMRLECI